MKMEIERKFLVKNDSWRQLVGTGLLCEQGYLSSSIDEATVRVRRMGNQGFLTLKGPTEGVSRLEMEYPIPVEDAETMLRMLCNGRTVSKVRYRFFCEGFTWEVDEFSGMNEGLVLAEIELENEEQSFDRPGWLGQEVSHDSRYFNAALAHQPFKSWRT
ncbi:CYTH domain-containing protein [Tichowtungia aerotolerans]|uniref:CYTH domain-containing protein n=1 Tax=Tichowtungia aerotolerans TaxID=2697043 RepID=A0A6P1M6I1_9BACT|nr:CYTH domain-containing protein [Tichowtungia aerotolerans]QHI68613.1 CYTH domain-containing protein [Tichowtungia aerotolerans]